MEIKPLAYFHSPLEEKFGVPRQSGLADKLRGKVVFEPEYRDMNALRGIEGFDYLWLIWGFSAVPEGKGGPMVRPPRLGGNESVGVFASRSPFRPNRLGLSSVRLEAVVPEPGLGSVLEVLGADLMDGTPIYDIKPYLPYTDSHPSARAGFTDDKAWEGLDVVFPDELKERFQRLKGQKNRGSAHKAAHCPSEDSQLKAMARHCGQEELQALVQILSLDPRPHYHDDPERIYGISFSGLQIRFRVADRKILVIDVVS